MPLPHGKGECPHFLPIEDPSESDAIRWFSFRGEHVSSLYG